MGLLRIYTQVAVSNPDMMDACEIWLKRECKASIKLTKANEFIRLYRIEGEGIPKGETALHLLAEEIVPNVFSIRIM